MSDITQSMATEVCRFCGGETELRHGSFGERIHKRQRPRVGTACPHIPELIPRAEYEALQDAKGAE
jgi:hypothetical protein